MLNEGILMKDYTHTMVSSSGLITRDIFKFKESGIHDGNFFTSDHARSLRFLRNCVVSSYR